jgi:hypothetical protein
MDVDALINTLLQFGMGGAFIVFLILQSRNTQTRLDEKDKIIAAQQEARINDLKQIANSMQVALQGNQQALNALQITIGSLHEKRQ